ncbi:MAG TPA: hypothetical protein VIL43_00195, partial [Burkholderiales bacterium]
FWVVGHFLNESLGWRETLVVFAAINLAVCLPLNWFGLARREPADIAPPREDPARAKEGPPLEGPARTLAMILFALVMSLNAFVFGVISVQLVPLLEGAGLATAAAVWVASMKGFAQFAGRVVELVFGRRLHAMTVARIAIGVLPVSFALLWLGHGRLALIVAFTLLTGASQGVVTIVRGAVPLALFGPKGYGAVLGILATPILLVTSASPTVFALIVDAFGWRTAEIVLIAASAASCIAMEIMTRWYERRRG